MSAFDDKRLTQSVLQRVDSAPDPRMRKISRSLVEHLHAFIRDVRPTQQEWGQAIEFLTRVGHMCDDRRQEFILLSDVLGVSMLVDALNHDGDDLATDSTVLGPFYVEAAPQHQTGADLAGEIDGEQLYVSGRVLSCSGDAIAGAEVDVWQADGNGLYDVQKQAEDLHLRARFTTGDDGRFAFRTIVPCSYPIPDDGPVGDLLRAQGRHPWRPAHIHFRIAAPEHRTLTTHLFIAGDPYLESDAVFGVKDSLIVELKPGQGTTLPDGNPACGVWRMLEHVFRLTVCGDDREQ